MTKCAWTILAALLAALALAGGVPAQEQDRGDPGAEPSGAPTVRAGASSEVEQWIERNLSGLAEPAPPAMPEASPPPPGGYRTLPPGGMVDWGNGYMSFTAERILSGDTLNPARDRAMAVRRATLQARKALTDATLSLAVDGRSSVAEALAEQEVMQVRLLLQNSRVQQEEYPGADGAPTLAVSAVAELRGDLAEAVLPPAEPFLAGVPATIELTSAQVPAPRSDPEEAAYKASMAELGGFTGLVVDARGLGARPALLPTVADPAGLTAYGSFQISREDAVRMGAALYVGDPANSLVRLRTGKSPLTVRALAASGPHKADLVVSYEDARLIRALFKNEDPRNRCAAVIILD